MLVAFHDKTLDRVTDRAGRDRQLPHQQVARGQDRGTEPIPLLEDLLGAWPDARFNIDVKDAPAVRPLAELLRRTGAWDRVCITSFSARPAQGHPAGCSTGRSAWRPRRSAPPRCGSACRAGLAAARSPAGR